MSLRDSIPDRAGLVELCGSCRATCQHPGVDREGDMGPFAADHRPVRAVEPLPADLAQCVCAPLRRRAVVLACVGSRLGIEDRAEGGQERFAGLGVEVTVDTDHPKVGRRSMEPPPGPGGIVASQVVSVVDLLAPEADDTLQVADRVDPGGLQKLRLGTVERRRVGLASGRQHLDGRHRDLSFLEGSERAWHVPQRPSDAQFRPGVPPSDLVR